MIDIVTGVIPLVLVVAFLLLMFRSMDGRGSMVDRMKQSVGGTVMLLVGLLVVFAFIGGGGDDPTPGPDPPEPVETYAVSFFVATDSIGYGTVSNSSLQAVPEGTAVTIAQTLSFGGAGQCAAVPTASTSEYTYAFSHWTGADDADTPAATTITADTAYYAHFTRTEVPPETVLYDVSFFVATDSIGYGTVGIQGLSDVPDGTAVTVAQTISVGGMGQCAATPAADTAQYEYAFSHWTGADDASTPAPTSIDTDTAYYAHFTRTEVVLTPMDPSLFTYTVSNGIATVTGWAGAAPADGYDLYLPETDGNGHPLAGIFGSSSIATSTFSGAKTLKSDTVTNVGQRAFRNAGILESVDLPLARTIGVSCFYGCESLESVDLPLATTIGQHCFAGCESLKSVNLPSVSEIENYAFDSCTGIETVTLGPLSSIGNSSFRAWTFYNTNGTTVLSKTVANLKNSTFQGTASALVKVAAGAKTLSPEMQQRAAELAAENVLKASMLADLDPELADMDSTDVARMTINEIRGLTSEDVQALKQAVRDAKAARGE